MPGLAKASCKGNGRNWNICCRVLEAAEWKCRSSGAELAPAVLVKLSLRRTAGKFTAAFGMLKNRLRMCGGFALSSAKDANQGRLPRLRWWGTRTRGNQLYSMS